MQAIGRQPQRAPSGAPFDYERHRPEQTALYRLVQQHAAIFITETEVATAADLPHFVKYEFDACLECSILAHGFAGPTETAWRRGTTHKRHPRETIFGGAAKDQQFSATFRDRPTRVGCCIRGAIGKKGRLRILFPERTLGPLGKQQFRRAQAISQGDLTILFT